MTRIIEKRRSLHRNLAKKQEQNQGLKLQVSQLQALANIGTATSMIAHEINNLLTPLSSYAALSLQYPDDEALAKKALHKTVQNCERASKITESILAMVNGEAKEKKNVRLFALVDEIFSCLCRDFSKDGITVGIEISEELEVWAVPVEIQQVLMNLILNAREAMLEGGGVLTMRAGDDSEAVRIEVADTGCGIEADNVRKIFEPFFTTKGDTKSTSQRVGAGLGLAFCKKVIDGHNGSILVESESGMGTSFKIILPKLRQGDS